MSEKPVEMDDMFFEETLRGDAQGEELDLDALDALIQEWAKDAPDLSDEQLSEILAERETDDIYAHAGWYAAGVATAEVAGDELEYADWLAALEPGETAAPISTWEQYLAASTGSPNPDAAEQALRDRAVALDLVDARFIGLEHLDEAGQTAGYSVGCIEVYGEGGSYLELGRFADAQDAIALVDAVQEPLDNGELAPHAVHEWAEFAAQALDTPVQWREVEREDLEAFRGYMEQKSEKTRVIPSTGSPDILVGPLHTPETRDVEHDVSEIDI